MNRLPLLPVKRPTPPRPVRGFSLIVILLMMVALAMLALGSMNSSIIQERMVGNERDRQVALQAAESAIRDAEIDIELNVTPASGFAEGCANGLCIPPSDTTNNPVSAPLWQSIDWNATRAYGSRTGAPALLGPDNVAPSHATSSRTCPCCRPCRARARPSVVGPHPPHAPGPTASRCGRPESGPPRS